MARSRICVLTGCQMEGLVAALQILLPNWDVEGFHTYRLRDADGSEIAARIRSADIVFSMPLDSTFGPFSEAEIGSTCARVQIVPQVVFPAFHPDITYIPKKGTGHVQSPLTDYNSIIAVCGFLLGFDISKTLSLYNSYVYQKLGYFDIFPRCRSDIIADFAGHGIDIKEAFSQWFAHPECFMYSVNHPRAHVLADITVAACRAADIIVPKTFPCPEFMPDKLASWVIYPVFPEIGERLGKKGHYFFKALSFDRMNIYDLENFVTRSFEGYSKEESSIWDLPIRLENSRAHLMRLFA